jgi:hypothetical protein
MVSTIPSYRPAGVRRIFRLFSVLSFVPLDVYYVVVDPAFGEPIPKYNGHAPTGWFILLRGLTRGATAEELG